MTDSKKGVKGIVVRDGRVLVLRKPGGGFDFPGGRVETGESFKDAFYREVKEEIGLGFKLTDIAGTWQTESRNQSGFKIQGVTFLCNWVSGEVTLSPEHESWLWCLPWMVPSNLFKRFLPQNDFREVQLPGFEKEVGAYV